jgi:hypothetical protein
MEYSEYHEKELTIRRAKAYSAEQHKEVMDSYNKALEDLTNEYLGDFAVGKAVKVLGRPEHEGQKFYVEEVGWLSDNRVSVSIRKARKDGSFSAKGLRLWHVDIKDLEVWNEL